MMLFTVMALVLMLCLLGWGPGTHLDLATRLFRERHERLPRSVAQLLGREEAAFLYGNLAPDFINFKALKKKKVDCHRWEVVEALGCEQREARRAFALGYLAHLAADTVAHNHFVPYHLVRHPRARGHYYWEQCADRFVPVERWALASELKRDRLLDSLDDAVCAAFPDKPVPMRGHKLVFDQFVLIGRRKLWRRGLELVHPRANVPLDRGLLTDLTREALLRMAHAVGEGAPCTLAGLDPNGFAAEHTATHTRRALLGKQKAKAKAETPGLAWATTEHTPERLERLARRLAAPFLEGLDHRKLAAGIERAEHVDAPASTTELTPALPAVTLLPNEPVQTELAFEPDAAAAPDSTKRLAS